MTVSLLQPLPPHAVYSAEPLFPLSVDQYHALIRSGKLTEADPVELLEGILVFKTPKNAPHATANGLVRRQIETWLPPGWHYRSQEPITLSDGEPEPDGAVVRGRIEDYAQRHPGPRDVALVIEIADTSLDRDRGIKLRSYARAGIPKYWIVNLLERQIEMNADPEPYSAEPAYRRVDIVTPGSMLTLVINGTACGDFPATSLLP